jgi:hypothetical protein
VWHSSVSITDPTRTRRVRSAGVAERAAVAALAGVGNEREWWRWNTESGVGHLRVGGDRGRSGRAGAVASGGRRGGDRPSEATDQGQVIEHAVRMTSGDMRVEDWVEV